MPPVNPHRLMRKLAKNTKACQAARLRALRFLGVSLSFADLHRIASDPNSPGRVAAYATDLYLQKAAAKQLKENPDATSKDVSRTD